MGNPLLNSQEEEFRERAETAAAALYRKAGLQEPRNFVWFRSPFALCKYISHKRMSDGLHAALYPADCSSTKMPHLLAQPTYWRFARSTPSPVIQQLWTDDVDIDKNVLFLKDAVPVMEAVYDSQEKFMSERQLTMLRAVRQAGRILDVFAPYASECFMCDKPVKTHLDAQGRYSALTEAAISYADGWKVYAVDGLKVPKWFIEQPHKITPQEIDECRNVTLRRIMIRLYPGDYYTDCDATLMATDEIGRLYRKPRFDDTDFVFVRVTNSTREPDGTFREYVLRVPPRIGTPVEAVAWTFGMTAEQYLKTQKMT